jgi:glycosyltransferase involved in cell wall biosynthesis
MTSSEKILNVAIDATGIAQGGSGGVGQALVTLVHDLARLNDGNEKYTIIAKWDEQEEWLKPHIRPVDRIVRRPASPPSTDSVSKRLAKRFVQRLRDRLVVDYRKWPEVPISKGFYESLGCDVIHFLNQMDFVLCALPTIYNPHDLQHLHYPRFWTPSVLALRETIYPAACHFAQTVVVGSQWIKDDVVRQYRISPEKIQIIPEGPPTQSASEPTDADIERVKEKYVLGAPFAIYPAVPWEHKNHVRLLEALALLRDTRGLVVPLVCTGSKDAYWPKVEKRIGELNLSEQVKFLGFVPDEELRCLYRLSQFLVLPTLFEASSLPMFEAWFEGVPVASSNATALPDQALDTALFFDPLDVGAIADAIVRMATDANLRRELIERGRRRLQDFNRERTAKAYRAVYRRAAHFPLTEEDRVLLSWDWMRHPEKNTSFRSDDRKRA